MMGDNEFVPAPKRRGRPRKSPSPEDADYPTEQECGGCTRRGYRVVDGIPWCGRPGCREFIEAMQNLSRGSHDP